MKKIEKGIDVLCVFSEGTAPPMPRKFKIKYRNGTIKTVSVDQVKLVENNLPLGLHNYVFHCASEIEECLIEYELRYFVNEMRWELFKV